MTIKDQQDCQNKKLAEIVDLSRLAMMERLSSNQHLSREEIEDVAKLSTRLFPSDLKLEGDMGDNIRLLCRLSRVAISPSLNITSHRPVIGPIIVRLKKIMLPIISLQLKGIMESVEEFLCLSIELIAKQHTEIDALKKMQPRQTDSDH